MIYFSDGCTSQYKNCKNFVNLYHHLSDFGIEALWNFFATSHDTNACDGIGGITKRQAASASLQMALQGQILIPLQLFRYCGENISSKEYFFVPSNDLAEMQPLLRKRFQLASTIPGTRDTHCSVPTCLNTLKLYRISSKVNERGSKYSH